MAVDAGPCEFHVRPRSFSSVEKIPFVHPRYVETGSATRSKADNHRQIGGSFSMKKDYRTFTLATVAGIALALPLAARAQSAAGTGEPEEHVLRTLRVEGTQSEGDGASVNLSDFGKGAGANGSTDVTATEGTGSLTGNGVRVGSKAPTALRDIPQTVNIITSEQFKQQNLNDVTGALSAMPGVTVNYTSGNTPIFISRGFQITSYQVDGGPTQTFPGATTYLSPPDLSAYDHIEIVRGSSAVFSGAGDPGGVVNLQRKRPLDHQQVVVEAQGGSYNNFRGQLDASTPLTADGALRVRGVAAYQDRDFFTDLSHRKQLNLYGVAEYDFDEDSTVRAGYRYQKQDDDSPYLSGLPRFTSGGDLRLPRSFIITAPWAFSDESQKEWFAQVDHRFGNDWQLNLSLNKTITASTTETTDIRGGLRPDRTGLLYQGNIRVLSNERDFSVGGSLIGDFTLFDRKQSFTFGAEYLRTEGDTGIFQQIIRRRLTGTIDTFDPATISPPNGLFNDSVLIPRSKSDQYSVYGSLVLEPAEGLHINGGLRFTSYKAVAGRLSTFSGVTQDIVEPLKSNSNFTPSIGVSYDVDKIFSIYASYAETFKPAGVFLTTMGEALPPRRGRTAEAGIKAVPFNGKMNLSLAYFDTFQRNVPIQVSNGVVNVGSCCYAGGGGIGSHGVDFQFSGAVTPTLQVNGGYSYTVTKYNRAYLDAFQGGTFDFAVSQQPRHQAKLWAAWTLPGALDKFTISGGGRYESARATAGRQCTAFDPNTFLCTATTPFEFSQKGYAVADLRVGFKPNAHWELAASVTNLTDTRYYTSAAGVISNNFYGEPRQFMLSARAQY